MKRRNFLLKAGTGAAALGVTAACGSAGSKPGESSAAVVTSPRVSWKLASSFPRSLDTIFGAANIMAERVKQLTDGRFSIRVHSGGELVPAFSVLDAVQTGSVAMGHSAGYYYTGKNPALAFDTAIPFGLTARQQNAWLFEGGGLDLMRKVYADFNMINFPGGNTGAQMGGWFRKEMRTLADFKGLKMRIPGLGGEVMSRMGVTVQVISGGDIYLALERGTIDATEWVGPYDDEKLGFYKVAKYYYYPGWWEPGPNLSFMINRDAWDKLPPLYQQAIQVATAEANALMLSLYDAKNPPALARLLDEKNGVKMRPFPDDFMTEASKTAEELTASLAAADASYSAILEAWTKFRADSHRWFATAEMAYAKFAYKP